MNKTNRFIFGGCPISLLLAGVIVLLFGLIAIASNDDVAIIGNKSIQSDSLSPTEIKQIFLGEKKMWGNNQQIVLATLNEEKIYNLFLTKYIQRSPLQYRNYWKNMIFTGKGRSTPRTFDDENALIQFVSETQGAIGYISSAVNIPNIKVIPVSTGGRHD